MDALVSQCQLCLVFVQLRAQFVDRSVLILHRRPPVRDVSKCTAEFHALQGKPRIGVSEAPLLEVATPAHPRCQVFATGLESPQRV